MTKARYRRRRPARAHGSGHPCPHPPSPAGKSAAHWAYDRLILYICNFEQQLDQDQEIAMGFVGGEAGVLQIEGVGYYDPDILTFFGRDEDGVKTQLVQHVSQLNLILRAVPKREAEEPPRRIGFRLSAGNWQGGESGDGSAPEGRAR